MQSSCGKFVISYNGEVYNHLELRRELEPLGHSFRGTSDTETILAAIAQWGVAKAIKRFVGMFAMAVWDRTGKQLFLIRDRMGIKPLYYGKVGDDFLFGSELKALRRHPAFSGRIDRQALTLYFRHNYIPAPHSIYEGINKLLPGEMVVVDKNGLSTRKYWDTGQVWTEGAATPLACAYSEAVQHLEEVLGNAVTCRMLSDVSLGAFLSGGIDSSLVTALMQQASPAPVNTFSIGFHEKAFNEAGHAAQVAAHLGTNHTELYVTAADLLDVVPQLPHYWDEPFADSSQVPTYILSSLTRNHVTVSLSGDGGDELFSGYERYFWTAQKWKILEKIPLRTIARTTGKMLARADSRLAWRLQGIGSPDFRHFYRHIISHFKTPEALVLGGSEPAPVREPGDPEDLFHAMSREDLTAYLPDDILTKVDRASMASGLEARVPLLDHRVVRFASRLPAGWKVKDGKGKRILRDILYRHVPQQLVDRPKTGFGVPIRSWLGKELRDWCHDLLNPQVLKEQDLLDENAVTRIWQRFLAGDAGWTYYLWDILMLQSWLAHETAGQQAASAQPH